MSKSKKIVNKPAVVAKKPAPKPRRVKLPKDVGIGKPLYSKIQINYKGKPTAQVIYRAKRYTRKEIMKIGQKISDDAKKSGSNCELSISLMYDDEWNAGYFFSPGQEPRLYTRDLYEGYRPDQDTYKAFAVYMIGGDKKRKKGGNSDGTNDCLYNCLVQLIPYAMKKHFKGAIPQHEFKKFLGLERYDKVDYELIPKIEDKIGMRISVLGDEIYTSEKEFKNASDKNIEIILLLKEEHYTIYMKGHWKTRRHHLERTPMVYHKKDSDGLRKVFSGEKVYKVNTAEFDKLKGYYSNYILISDENFECDIHDPRYSQYKELIEQTSNNKLIWAYNEFSKIAKEMKELTNGKINMFKTGNIQSTVMALFQDRSKAIQPDDILQDEAMWIRCATMGPLVYGRAYEGPAYKADKISFYGSIMRDNRFPVPIRRGTFKTMTQEEFEELKFFPYSIFRCVITKDNTFFKKNKKYDYYTHYDLRTAKEMNLNIELVDDGKPNVLLYNCDDDCLGGDKIFKEIVDELFLLKSKGIIGAKLLLNTLWGKLCRQQKKQFDIKCDESFEIYSENTLTSINPSNDDPTTTIVKFVNNEKGFDSNYARMKPFLVAKGRRDIYRTMKPNIENVVRIHTDGFITITKMKCKFGDKIGDLRDEGYCPNVHVLNSMRVIGKFE